MASRDAIIAEIPRLRRYARALTGNDARADDLVQDTLERALARWSLWRPGNLRAWLFSVMHNLFVNQLASGKMLDFVDPATLPEPETRDAQSDGLELRDIERALHRMSAEQREVLLLVGLEELAYDEAAKVLGVPVGTVMSRLSRARERLRALLSHAPQIAESHLKVVK